MTLKPSEQRLLVLTAAVVVLALTYFAFGERFRAYAAREETRNDLLARKLKAEALLDRQEDMVRRLAAFRGGLPVFQPGQTAASDLLPALEKMAPAYGITLTRRESPEEERAVGELFETSLTCSWEGTLSSLVRFLHAQQSLGPVSDVRLLEVKPLRTNRDQITDRLSGKFTIDYAYTRGSAPSAP